MRSKRSSEKEVYRSILLLRIAFMEKEKNVVASDSKEYRDVYSLTAIKPDTRLFLSHHEGKRTADDCIEFFGDIERRRELIRLFLYLVRIIGIL